MNKLNSEGWLAALTGLLVIASGDALFILKDGIGIPSGIVMALVITAGGYVFKSYFQEKKKWH